MDEVQMVRDGYLEPAPPTARDIAQAKALLTRPPRRPLPRLWWGMGGLVAAGAAATVAIAMTGGNTPESRPAPVKLDGRGAFLAAAEKAERQSAGKYWSADTIQGQSYIVRPKTGTYAITGAHDESFGWWGVKSGMGEAYYGRDLPARPQTAADVALWRKAGAPKTFRVWSGDHFATYTTKVSKWRSDGPEQGKNPNGGGHFLGGLSAEDLQKLPADPARLAERFLSQAEMNRAVGLPPGASAQGRPQWDVPGTKIMMVASLLGAPVPPKVRAGLMRALAAQPGIHTIGRDRDPLGRPGIALAADDRARTVTGESGTPNAQQGTYRTRAVIIFDERTGAMLSQQEELTNPGGPYAEMKPGFIINYQTRRSARWTDTKPTPPAELPFG